MDTNTDKRISKVIKIFLAVAVLINIKSILTDFDRDCAYAVVNSYRFILGDRLFLEMREPHQTSAVFLALFEWLFVKLFDSTEGMVVYLQTISVCIYGIVSFAFYKFLKKYTSNHIAELTAITFFVLRAKQEAILAFSNALILASMMLLIFLVNYFENHKLRSLVLAAFFLCVEIIAYPSTIVTYFAIVFLLVRYSSKKIRDIFVFSITCLMCGISFLIFISRGYGLKQLLFNCIFIVNSDETHSGKYYGWIYWEQFVAGMILLAVCLVIAYILGKIFKKSRIYIFAWLFSVSLVILTLYDGLLRDNEYNFWIYSAGILIIYLLTYSILSLKYCCDKTKRLYWTALFVSISSFIAVFLLTNMNLLYILNYMLVVGCVSFIPIAEKLGKTDSEWEIIAFLSLICFSFYFPRLALMREYGGAKDTVIEVENIVRSGPARGIICSYMGYYTTMCNIEDFDNFVNDGDRLLIVTTASQDPIPYLYKDVVVSHYSTISTPTFSSKLIDYWNEYPDKYPNVIAVECWYGDIHVDEDSYIMHFVNDNFEKVDEGRYYAFYR